MGTIQFEILCRDISVVEWDPYKIQVGGSNPSRGIVFWNVSLVCFKALACHARDHGLKSHTFRVELA